MSGCRSRKALVRASCATPRAGAVEDVCSSPNAMPSRAFGGGDGREVKHDGERAQCERGHGQVELLIAKGPGLAHRAQR